MCFLSARGKASGSTVTGAAGSPGKTHIFLLYSIITEQIGESRLETAFSAGREQNLIDTCEQGARASCSARLKLKGGSVSACVWFPSIKHRAGRYAAGGDPIRQNNSIDLKIEASQLLCDQSVSLPCLSLSLHPTPHPSPVESIQGHANIFLEGEQTQGGPASQQPSDTPTEGGGGREEGGRRGSSTSVESETSICSMGQLGNTIANSEWDERDSGKTSLSHSVKYLLWMKVDCRCPHSVLEGAIGSFTVVKAPLPLG